MARSDAEKKEREECNIETLQAKMWGLIESNFKLMCGEAMQLLYVFQSGDVLHLHTTLLCFLLNNAAAGRETGVCVNSCRVSETLFVISHSEQKPRSHREGRIRSKLLLLPTQSLGVWPGGASQKS